jgi:Ca-activated chloride channel family protein
MKQAVNLPGQEGMSRSVVLVTDGYISGEQGVFDYIRQNLGRSNVFAFGIGESVNRYLIEGVAHAGMGEPFIVTNAADATATAAKFREYIQNPVLTDINIKTAGFETYDVEPRQLPAMFAQRPVILYGKWRGNPTGTFEIRGKTGHGDFVDTLDVANAQPDAGNSALRYLWARSRIAELSDYGVGEPTDHQIKEITSLGLKYNLLTRYTSFIAVREKVVNPDGKADDVEQPLPLPLGVSDMAIGSEPELVWLFAAVGVVGLFFVARRRWGLGLS